MVGNKPIIEQWRRGANSSMLSVGLLVGGWFLIMLFPCIIWPWFWIWSLLFGAFIFIGVFMEKYYPYKCSMRAVEQEGIARQLQSAFEKAYENETVEFGAVTDYGIITGEGFAPWKYITKITVRSKEMKNSGKHTYQAPCYLMVDVALDKKTRYSLKVIFVQNRDVAHEIERYIERALKYNNRILIDNTYVFIN